MKLNNCFLATLILTASAFAAEPIKGHIEQPGDHVVQDSTTAIVAVFDKALPAHTKVCRFTGDTGEFERRVREAIARYESPKCDAIMDPEDGDPARYTVDNDWSAWTWSRSGRYVIAVFAYNPETYELIAETPIKRFVVSK